MHLLELLPTIERGLVMVQAEVGARIAAPPGSKEYGSPSAKAAWYGTWALAGNVSRKVFWPVPGVDSVLVSYQRAAHAIGTETERQKTFDLINAAFAQRRKMLRQSLQAAIPNSNTDTVTEILRIAGIEPSLRAEQLHITDYLTIARTLV